MKGAGPRSELEKLAALIADQQGSPPKDTGDPPEGDYARRNLANLGDIANAFQTASQLATKQRPCLFKWRHLEVERELDSGGFGTVYKAWDPTLKRAVALKLVSPDQSSEVRQRLLVAEAQRMARVRHPNILAVHGADSADGRAGIWCDLLDGGTLEQTIVARGPMSPSTVVDLALPLTEALALIHRKAMSHGDIKPANIMIQSDGTPVLMDFGAVHEALSTGATSYGSPLVMAPEQFRGQPPSPATDIYSLGTVLFYSLTGAFPVRAESLDELTQNHQRGHSVNYSDVPNRWRGLLQRLLNPDPERRPTGTEVTRALLRIKTAKPRLLRRLAVGVVTGSLVVATITATLAYRSASQSRDRTALVKDVVVDAVEASLPTSQSGPASLEALYAKLAELIEQRLVEYPDALAEMRLVAGKGFGQLGDAERGLEIAERGLQLMLEVRPNSPRDLASSQLAVSSLRKETGDMAGAEQVTNRALQQLANLRDDQSAAIRLRGYNQLAGIYSGRGDWHKSVEANQQLLSQRRALHGENSVRLAVDYHNVASGQHSIGEYTEALRNWSRAAQLLREAGDAQSLRMGFVLQAMALAEIETGQYQRAESTIEQARQLLQETLPADHLRLRTLEVGEALMNLRRGRAAVAVAQLQDILGRPNPTQFTRFQVNRQLGDALVELGQWEQAQHAYDQVLQLSSERYQFYLPFYEAGLVYTDYRAGLRDESPLTEIEAAMNQMRESGYDKLPQYDRLAIWHKTLSEERPSE